MTALQKDTLDLLVVTSLPWATITSRDQFGIRFRAQPIRASGEQTRPYDLSITVERDGKVIVKEASQNRMLPVSCPQRHINDGGAFCIGLGADVSVVDIPSAGAWWRTLEVFLTCQETADESGSWPDTLQLSHGDAAEIQLAAEKLAERLGQKYLYELAVAYDEGPIAELCRQVSRITGRLRRKRELCACGYTRNGRVKNRQDCARDNNPCLPVLEARRRREEARFWRQREAKFVCCGTMKVCPLKSRTVD